MATLKELLASNPNHHLKPLAHRFADENTPVHPHMAESANWMNEGDTLEDPPIFVRFNGDVRPCTNLIHLDQWLRGGGVIVPKPA